MSLRRKQLLGMRNGAARYVTEFLTQCSMGNATCFEEQNIPIFLGQPFHQALKGFRCDMTLRNAND